MCCSAEHHVHNIAMYITFTRYTTFVLLTKSPKNNNLMDRLLRKKFVEMVNYKDVNKLRRGCVSDFSCLGYICINVIHLTFFPQSN